MILEFITIVVLVIGLVILFYNKVRINYVVVTKTIRPWKLLLAKTHNLSDIGGVLRFPNWHKGIAKTLGEGGALKGGLVRGVPLRPSNPDPV